MAYEDLKDWTRRTASDKILRNEAFKTAFKSPKYHRCQKGLASMVYQFFDEKNSDAAATLASKSAIKNANISNKELAKEWHKPITKIFLKKKSTITFIDYIWGVDPADIQLIYRFNKGIRFLLCVTDYLS